MLDGSLREKRLSCSRRWIVTRLAALAPLGLGAACAPPPAPTAAPPTTGAGAAPKPTPEVAKPAPGNTPAPTAAPQRAAPTPLPVKKFRYALAGGAKFGDTVQKFAVEKGWFKEAGLDVEIVDLPGDPNAQKGLAAGEFDAASIGAAGMMGAIAQGAPAIMVGGTEPWTQFLVAGRKEFNSVKDLYRKTFGASGAGSLPYIVMQAIFRAEKADFNQANFVAIGGMPDVVKALSVGKIDFGLVFVENQGAVLQNPDMKILFSAREKLPQFVTKMTFVNNKHVTENPAYVTGLMSAEIKSVRYTMEHRDETIELVARHTGSTNTKAIGDNWDFYQKSIWEPDGNVPASSCEYMQQLNVELGIQSKVIPTEQMLTQRFTDEAVKTLGKYQTKR